MMNGICDAPNTSYKPLPSEIWAKVLKSAWTKINNSVFSVDSLSCRAADLGCAAIIENPPHPPSYESLQPLNYKCL